MSRDDLVRDLEMIDSFVDAIIGLAEDGDPIACLASSASGQLNMLIEDISRNSDMFIHCCKNHFINGGRCQ